MRSRHDQQLPLSHYPVFQSDFQPPMISEITGVGTVLHINRQQWFQEFTKMDGIGFRKQIFLDHDAFQWPWFQGSNVSQGT